jgi:hypothetical protein
MTAKPRAATDGTAECRAQHWDDLYRTRPSYALSWTQAEPAMSLCLIDRLSIGAEDAIVDIGAGESTLVDALLARGHRAVTVLDSAPHALDRDRARLDAAGQTAAATVTWVVADVLTWRPTRTYRLWHDRAVFHFLTEPPDRTTYHTLAASAVEPGGFLVIGTFATDGPTHCSGLPVMRYDAPELAAEFAPQFAPRIAEDEHHHTPWGAVQHFTWLVLQRRP